MSEYNNTNTGALFKNDKQGNENWADYRGTINVSGEEYWLSAWIKTAKKDGSKFMSLAIKPKEAAPAPKAGKPTKRDEPDQEIPF